MAAMSSALHTRYGPENFDGYTVSAFRYKSKRATSWHVTVFKTVDPANRIHDFFVRDGNFYTNNLLVGLLGGVPPSKDKMVDQIDSPTQKAVLKALHKWDSQ
jgi:hypothetical protein